MKTYYFDTTQKAYDATHSGERVKKGDLLIIATERVVGVADKRPFAVSLQSGKFDRLARSATTVPGISAAHIEAARAECRRRGFDRPANDPPLLNSVWEKGPLGMSSIVKGAEDGTYFVGPNSP